jgi:DJ-1 family protein
MAKLACLLTNGFEDIEALGTVALLRRANIDVDFIGAMDEQIVTGTFKTKIMVDRPLKALDATHYDGIFIPGGKQAYVLKEDPRVLQWVHTFYDQGKWIFAICAAPIVLGVQGLLNGKKYVSFPGTQAQIHGGIRVDAPVAVDGKIITAIGAGAVYEFAFAIVEHMLGTEAMNDLKKRILYRAFA